MAQLRTAKEIGSDVVSEAPNWAKRLIDILNPFIRDVFSALSSQLTFSDNFANAIREFNFDTSASYENPVFDWKEIRFKHGLKVKAIGVNIMQINEIGDNSPIVRSAVSLDWTEVSGEIRIRYVAGLSNGKKYRLRVHAY